MPVSTLILDFLCRRLLGQALCLYQGQRVAIGTDVRCLMSNLRPWGEVRFEDEHMSNDGDFETLSCCSGW